MLQIESGGRTMLGENQPIKSSMGAMGLMQLMPDTYNDMRVQNGLGSSSTSVWLIFCVTATVVVSINGASPLTRTVSCAVPTASLGTIFVRRPTSTVIDCAIQGAKPSAPMR